jgi:hypothetical protein
VKLSWVRNPHDTSKFCFKQIKERSPLNLRVVNVLPMNVDTPIALAEHAAVIRALGKRVVGDIIEIGRRLTDAKKIAGHGNWLPWLEREFGWTDKTAERFMQVHSKSDKLSNLDVPVSGLYLLAAPSTPEEARAEVIERAEQGEALSVSDVQRIARRHGARRFISQGWGLEPPDQTRHGWRPEGPASPT